MKLFTELLKIIGLSTLVGILILFFSKSNHFSCSALETFDNESSFTLFFDFLKSMLIAFGIWLIGLISYFMIKKKRPINLLIFFPLLTIISLHSFITVAVTRALEVNRNQKENICAKSTDDGMLLTFRNLNKNEYDFIHSKTKWLPTIPLEPNIINIEYYRDEFLGDYDLSIELILKPEERLDTIEYPKWKFDGTNYHYNEFQN